jgi:hypothetical protein
VLVVRWVVRAVAVQPPQLPVFTGCSSRVLVRTGER